MKSTGICVAGVALLSTLQAAPLWSQVCAGFAPLTETPFQLAGGAAFNSDATAFGGSFTGGKDFFGTFGIGMTSYDALDASSFDLSFGAGYDFAVDQRRRAFLCPVGGLLVSLGPNDVAGTGIDLRTIAFAFGFSIGGIAAESPQFAALPAAGLGFARGTVTAEDRFGNSASESDTYGLFSVGLGLLINKIFTIHPGISVPFGRENAKVSFGISFAINFGRRPGSS